MITKSPSGPFPDGDATEIFCRHLQLLPSMLHAQPIVFFLFLLFSVFLNGNNFAHLRVSSFLTCVCDRNRFALERPRFTFFF